MTVYETYSDEQLLALLKTGDARAFTMIYDRYKDLLHRYANRWIQDRETIKDVIQELFTVIWTRRETLVLQQSLSGYLYVAVRNTILRKLSQETRSQAYIASLQQYVNAGESIADHRVRENQLRAIIEKEIALLPDRMREIFEMSRNGQLSHAEIAQQLGISEHTVRTQVKRALKVLRSRLGIFLFIYLLVS